MAERLTIGDLNPGDTFRFRGDDVDCRWEVIDPPKSHRQFLRKADRVFCVPTRKNPATLQLVVQCWLYPSEAGVLDIRRDARG